jgi:hypothetical protein
MVQNRKSILVLLIVTFLLTSIIVTLSQSISQSYFKTHTFFWDPVMAYSRNIAFHERMQAEANLNPIASRINFAKLYFKGEPKAPIYCLPIILLSPKLLLSPWANLPVSSLMFAIFLFILGYSVFLRTKNILLPISIMFLVSAAPVLFDPKWGIASSWYDLPSGFLLVASIISFVNWHFFRKTHWLVLFSILVSLASMGRYINAAYAFIIIAPLFLYSLIIFYKSELNFIKNIVKPIGIVLGIVLLLSGYFLWYHLEFTLNYYSKMAYAISDSSYDCLKDFLIVFKMIGSIYSYNLFLLVVVGLYFVWKQYKKFQVSNFIFFLWIIISLPLFWIVIFKSLWNYNTDLIELPIIHILWLVLIPVDFKNKKVVKYGSIFILSISIFFIISSYYTYSNISKNTSPLEKEEKQLTSVISKQIKDIQPQKSWASFFAPDYSRIINCECFYNYNVFPKINKEVTFYVYSTYWKFFYKDKSVQEISKNICENIEKSDVFITFNTKVDVNIVIKPNQLDDFKIAKQITNNVVDYMNNNQNWEKEEVISTIKYSNLAVYIKK